MSGHAGGRRLGILGGTFDPVHRGHLAAAHAVADALGLDAVLLVPAGDPYHREHAPVAPAADRLAMVRAAAADDPLIEASPLDIDRAGPTYTVDLLRELAAAEPGAERFLLLGADALRGLPSWRDPAGIGALATVIGMTRPGEELADPGIPGIAVRLVAIPPVDVSSTQVRAALAAGAPADELVPAPVLAYAREHGLYGAR